MIHKNVNLANLEMYKVISIYVYTYSVLMAWLFWKALALSFHLLASVFMAEKYSSEIEREALSCAQRVVSSK